MADAPDVTGSIEVPVIDPYAAFIVAIFPWLAPLFTEYQALGYTAYPELSSTTSNNLLATASAGRATPAGSGRTCTTTLASSIDGT